MVRIYCAYPKDLALIQSLPRKIHPFAMPDTSLDAFDIAILDILQQDNTTPQRAIAEAVHLSPAAVPCRVCRPASHARRNSNTPPPGGIDARTN